MRLSEARGKLVLIGGAEDKKGERAILKEFVRLAGGARARLVVMTVATDKPEEVGEEYLTVFKELGIDDVKVVDVSAREDANSQEAMALVEKATGLFFTGGDQLHITALLGGTQMHSLIFERFGKGVVIAGTSAGASMMGNSMIISGERDHTPRFGAVEIGPGMDFVLGAIVDVHFSERGRMGRLLTAVAHFPHDLGFGVDEDTAMVMTSNQFEVIGSGSVTVIDAGDITYTNLPDLKKKDSLSLYNIKVHVLSEGHKYDLSNREPIIEYAAPESSNGNKAKKENNGKKSAGAKKIARAARAKG
jgi:cyanophycinase